MIKIYLLSMVLLLIGCSTEKTIKAIVVPSITQSYTEIEDKELGNNYIINEENHFKSQNEIDTSLKYMEDSNMVLSSILNFNRLSHDDKFAILQPDKIFLNTIELKYLTLPTFNSNVKLELLDLRGISKEGEIIKESVSINRNKENLFLKFKDISKIDFGKSKSIDYFNKKNKKETISTVYHDRAMGCIFVNNNDADFHGYANIQKTKNFKVSYITYNKNIDSKIEDIYTETILKVGEAIDEGFSVVSTSLGLFDNKDRWLKKFHQTLKDLKNNSSSIEKFYKKQDIDFPEILQRRIENSKKSIDRVKECIFDKNDMNCKNNKFTWVLSLSNLKEDNIDDTLEENSKFKELKHTMFVTAVSSEVYKPLSNNPKNKKRKGRVVFNKAGRVFSENRDKELAFFAINLPEKVLVAHGDKKLKFVGKSTSYATAIVSAVLYNLYSLNPNLTFHNAETILKKTAYNFQCEDNPTLWIDYKVLNSDYNYNYEINCSKHDPFKVGYIINIREAYKEAIKYLVDTYHFNNQKPTKKSDEESVYDNFPNYDNIEPNSFQVEFSKESVVCKYKTKLNERIIEKEITIKYKENGKPEMVKEKNIFIKNVKKLLL